ncbi:hypothetical protein EsDP_00006457 [Epichloe bromicola]|uniref:Metalloendopeptidase n=1 Tax=Epichloe bromicola TaxID=79588 RepID=A0ABQ0CXX5_9HYPO
MFLLAKLTAWLTFFVCVVVVEAGSKAWERTHNAADAAKRWVSTEPLKGEDARWPSGTIKYCWADSESEKILSADLTAGRDAWYRAGLDERSFKWEKQNALTCRGNINRRNWLKIKYNDKGVLSTTIGLQPVNEKEDADYKGPTMHLSDSLKVGFLERVSNYAHEIGHAWGLLHEHKEPNFWERPFSSKMGTVWGAQLKARGYRGTMTTFHCDHLSDYDEHWPKWKAEHPDDDEICVLRLTAKSNKFAGATQYLPLAARFRSHLGVTIGAGENAVDWDSLMLYPSGAGGKGDVPIPAEGQPPLDLVTQDPRQPVSDEEWPAVPKFQDTQQQGRGGLVQLVRTEGGGLAGAVI